MLQKILDFRQSDSWAQYLATSGWKVSRLDRGYAYIFNLPLLGSIIRIPRLSPPIPFAAIERLALRHRATLVKLEPDALVTNDRLRAQLERHGYQWDNWSIEPTNTLVIDLAKPVSTIVAEFKPKWRQYSRFAIKHGVKIVSSNDISTFANLWQSNARRKQHYVEKTSKLSMLWREFSKENRAAFLFARVGTQTVAGSFLIFWNKSCHLWHLAYNGMHENLRPLHALVLESIKLAKSRGAKIFDFEGISDPRLPYSSHLQPTFFKQGFGGAYKQYIGSFVKYYRPIASIPFRLFGRIHPDLFRFIYKSIYG